MPARIYSSCKAHSTTVRSCRFAARYS